MGDPVLIVLNPISGGGAGLRALPRLRDALARRGVQAEVFTTERAGDARRMARERGGEFERVVIVGGDGTINEVINGLADPGKTALGVVPHGTSNLLARELRLPRNPERAAALVAEGRTRPIDVCEAGARRFLMCGGIGFDAEVLKRLEAFRTGPISFSSYLRPILGAIAEYDFPEIRLAIDGVALKGRLAFLGNIRNYAAFFSVTPDALFDDGLLDVCVVTRGQRRDFVRWLASALVGRMGRYNEVTVRRGRRIEIDSDVPLPYEVDGDYAGETPVVIRVRHRAARILVDGKDAT
jgi:YegS/Rv2252/BmrU family lipid kinase